VQHTFIWCNSTLDPESESVACGLLALEGPCHLLLLCCHGIEILTSCLTVAPLPAQLSSESV
jgi:hypothetical protein